MGLISSDQRARLDICQGNLTKNVQPCVSYKPKSKRCDQCGCFMPLKVKIKAAACPQGKW